MLDVIKNSGMDVLGVGKIEDIFNRHAGSRSPITPQATPPARTRSSTTCARTGWSGLLFANLVDTDMLYGHRNDVKGFARALERFRQAPAPRF